LSIASGIRTGAAAYAVSSTTRAPSSTAGPSKPYPVAISATIGGASTGTVAAGAAAGTGDAGAADAGAGAPGAGEAAAGSADRLGATGAALPATGAGSGTGSGTGS